MGFVYLHLHTEYNLLDGACRIRLLMEVVKGQGQTAVAVTDHGVMYGAVDFYRVVKQNGLHPIIGYEVYVSHRTCFDKVCRFDDEPYHLVLLCENNIRYQNLAQIVSQSWMEGFYNKPRVDLELLEVHSEGLIGLSACLAGQIPRQLINDDYATARETVPRYRDIFGEGNSYLEMQDHGIREQKIVNDGLLRLPKEIGIPLVATNDCHYIRQQGSWMHLILLCIQTNHTIQDSDRMEFATDQFHLKSEEEMYVLFPQKVCGNTVVIAERCQVELELGHTKLPSSQTPNEEDNVESFRSLHFEGLHRLYGEQPDPAVTEWLEYELYVIESMGYANYYLIVYDFIRYAKSVGIPVGSGRGSGAGSLAAHCVGITGIDPIRYQLLLERFLNPERVSMPDFDIDFSDGRRGEMIDYIVYKYGADHVAQTVTSGTMAARSSLRDVGRVMATPYNVVDSVARLVPVGLNVTSEKALVSSSELRTRYDTDPQIRELIDMAHQVKGMPRNASTHAAGVVITDHPVSEYTPLAKNGESIVAQYIMTTLGELDPLKMDFLGLCNLSVLNDAQKATRRADPELSVSKIPFDDPKVFEMFTAGSTGSVFQFESGDMRSVIMQLHLENIEGLIAVILLYRPGPMESILRYIENRRHPERVIHRHPMPSGILEVTYGCIAYQEQVTQIFRTPTRYSFGRAGIVRRAMSKKKASVMEKERSTFLYGPVAEDGMVEVGGCVCRGVDEETAKAIFGEMESFASYAFSKSHAAACATISYQTAWLKYHYPREYMAALFTSVLDNTNKIAVYIVECSRMGIRVLPPSVNQSRRGFTAVGRDTRFGLLTAKNLGDGFLCSLIQERDANGNLESSHQFCKRMYGKDLNRRALESLVKCGALDPLDYNRNQMLSSIQSALDTFDSDKRRDVDGQLDSFDTPQLQSEESTFSIDPIPDFSDADKLMMEKEVTGMYLSGHPMGKYLQMYEQIGATPTGELPEEANEQTGRHQGGEILTLLGAISSAKLKVTKNDNRMAFTLLEGMYGSTELLVSPDVLERYGELMAEGSVVMVKGRLSPAKEKGARPMCDTLSPPSRVSGDTVPRAGADEQLAMKRSSGRPGLYLRLPSQESFCHRKALQYVAAFDGATPLYLYPEDTRKLMQAPMQYHVSVNEVLLGALRELLREEDIALVR